MGDGWSISKYYKRPFTIKLIILWDFFRVSLPMFYLLISIIILLKDKSEGSKSSDDSLFGRKKIIPSLTNGAKDTGDQVATLVFLLIELIRQAVIFVIGVIAYCHKFTVGRALVYFWARTINSCINILSHFVLFFVLKANSFLLILALFMFWIDGFFWYIIYIFWRHIKHKEGTSMSCSELSEIEARNEIGPDIEDQNRQLQEELKGGVPSDILEIEQYDDEGNYQTKIIRIDEENKQVAAEWVLPPISHKFNNISNDTYVKESPSKVTTFFEDPRDFMSRKDSYEAGYSSLTHKPKNILNNYESNRTGSTKDFVFTSSHIRMIDKSNICEEEEDDYLKNLVKNK